MSSADQRTTGVTAAADSQLNEVVVQAGEQIRKIFHHSSDAFLLIDPERNQILDVNPKACVMLGYSREELLSTPMAAIHPNEMPKLLAFAQSVFETGGGRTNELTYQTKTGQTIPAEISASVVDIAGRSCLIGMIRDIAERKRAEQALKQREELYRDLYENAPLAYNTVGIDGRILTTNAHTSKMLGFSRDELIGRPVFDLYANTPSGREKAKKVFQRFLDGEEPRDEELEWRRADGRSVWVSLTLRALRDPQGKIIAARAMVMDITERKQIEEALRESEQKFRRLVENAADAFFVHDLDGRIIDVNQQACDSLGYTREELLHMSVGDFSVTFSAAQIAATCKKMMPGVPLTIQGIERRKDGTTFPVEVRVGLFESSERSFILALSRDITERKRMEEALRESEEWFRDLYEEAPIAYFQVDLDTRIRNANRRASEMLGCPLNELIGRPVFDFLADTPSAKQKGQELLGKFRAGEEIRGEELEIRRPDGARVWGSLSSRQIRDAQGRFVADRSTLEDITVLKQTEEKLRASEQRLSRILESAMDAIISIDKEQRIILFNEAAEKVFRCRASDTMNQPLDRFLSDSFRQLLTRYLQAFEGDEEVRRYIWAPEGLTARRASGEEFPIEATISQVEAAGQKLYTIILRDVDERKRAEAALRKLELENLYLLEEVKTQNNFNQIIGASPSMKKVFGNVERVAATDSIVLLTGETGTGKELIARAIHDSSPRKGRVLVKVNCAALPGGLIESELFGHEKGAFTGATARRKGRFELADGGTIFLDEVGELPLETQAKLLRVLQEQEFERVGGNETIKVNVRVIAASNRSLEEMVRVGAFRADLFYRLNIFPIHIPPLRERPNDIPLLTSYYVGSCSRRLGKRIESITPEALEMLTRYHWPGNVRELGNLLERAVILCDGSVIHREHIIILRSTAAEDKDILTLEASERVQILKALEKTGGVIGGPQGAAKLLGINRTTLLSRMKKLGIAKGH